MPAVSARFRGVIASASLKHVLALAANSSNTNVDSEA